jgi:hypothetical protein
MQVVSVFLAGPRAARRAAGFDVMIAGPVGDTVLQAIPAEFYEIVALYGIGRFQAEHDGTSWVLKRRVFDRE